MTLGWLRFHHSKLPTPKIKGKHDFSYVLFRAALGAFGVLLIIGIDLDDHIIMLGGACLGLVLIASIVYRIHFATQHLDEGRPKKMRHVAAAFDEAERFLKGFNRLL
jgi:hypothetical protein